MAKNIFKPTEITYLTNKIYIEPPKKEEKEEPEEGVETLESHTGPTVEELRKEAEAYKLQWEEEKKQMIQAARTEADQIVKRAEKIAFDEIKKKNTEAQKIRQEAEDAAKEITAEARKQAAVIEEESKTNTAQIEQEVRDTAAKEGRVEGFEEGKAEVERLIGRLHAILTKAVGKRKEIIEESETQLINLVLLIAKKVIKVISENQKNVVINNVIQALNKIKNRSDIVIRTNMADLELTTKHIEDFMKMMENAKSITVLEDTSVEKGGCIIETDFGQIDARISSQLREIEEKIIDLIPIKLQAKD